MRTALSIVIRSILSFAILPSQILAQGGQHHHVPGVTIPVNAGFKQPPQPPPPVETPTTLTFFQNPDFSGASYSVQLKPPSGLQATRLVPTAELTGAGLAGKISAARIVCGTRPSRASLFDIDWGQFSSGTMIECAAGQKTDINLAADFGSRNLAKKINAAGLVVHVRTTDDKPDLEVFSTYFGAAWKTQVQSLGSGATAKGTQIWLDDYQDLHIQQMLQLNSGWCSSRGAVFEIRVNMSVSNYKPVFKGFAVSQYVDFGFGDMWGCHDTMMKDLSNGVSAAITSLQAQLPQLVLTLGQESPVYYFAPEGTTQDYDLFYYK